MVRSHGEVALTAFPGACSSRVATSESLKLEGGKIIGENVTVTKHGFDPLDNQALNQGVRGSAMTRPNGKGTEMEGPETESQP